MDDKEPEATLEDTEKKPENDEPKMDDDDDDDLEEGELKGDDDDDDDDDDEEQAKTQSDSSKSSSKSSGRASSTSSSSSRSSNPPSSPSSSDSSSSAKEKTSSRCSSKLESNYGSSTRGNDSNYERRSRITGPFSTRNSSDDKFRLSRGREREDPRDKAAKLISMRTKLLEAKSREIEMKFQKNKSIAPPSTPITLLSTITTTTSNLKMTLTKPSISYAENPKPALSGNLPTVVFKEKKSKKSKKRKKKKSKSSSKRHKKHKRSTSSTPKKKPTDVNPVPLPEENQPLPTNNHQGPRTPPDNDVVTLEDERIEWPSHLIKMTVTLPSISYSVNPAAVMNTTKDDNPPVSRKRRSPSSSSHCFNSDYSWYCEHFINSCEMDQNQAQHQAYYAMLSAGTYDQDALDKWLESRGFVRESYRVERPEDGGAIPLRPIQPAITILKSQKEVIMPNGQALPPGTVQKIVHPYAKTIDRRPEILGPYYDLLS